MRIGFLAMSGLRAHDPRLIELGLTLPGVIERGRVVASMPCLALLILAAATPDEHDVRYFEAHDAQRLPEGLFDCDLVAISALTAQAFEAYSVARQLRDRGIVVAMGGLHASVLPEEVAQYVDYVFVGEGERIWPEFLLQLPGRPTKQIWRASESGRVDFQNTVLPRYDLLKEGNWNRFPVQTTRGCPWRCDFCASSIMLQQPYRKRQVREVIRDIEAIKTLRRRPFIELADDNTFVDHQWGKELCEAIIPQRVKWFTETDISVSDDNELLRLLKLARCRQLLIGLESTDPEDLGGIELKADFKRRRAVDYLDSVRRIQSYGVTVNGCFVLGLDHQGPDIFERIFQFTLAVPLYEVQITVMTPFPGTPLYERLLQEDRIIEPGRWDLCTLFDVNFLPQQMSVQQLRDGIYWLAEKLYHPDTVYRRRAPFFTNLQR
jgi:radical SAM superfamily enzyme YgiQ (UPF0313 family)